jgi:hypothetical protein
LGKGKEDGVHCCGDPGEDRYHPCGCNEATVESDSVPKDVIIGGVWYPPYVFDQTEEIITPEIDEQLSSALDEQVGGSHYKDLRIQPIEYILANDLPFIEGNIIKYTTRWKQKGGVEDIKKVIHYAQILLEKNS